MKYFISQSVYILWKITGIHYAKPAIGSRSNLGWGTEGWFGIIYSSDFPPNLSTGVVQYLPRSVLYTTLICHFVIRTYIYCM